MSVDAPSDALVLFGFTGDLATKKIFPALYAMAKKGRLPARVVGVAGRPLEAAAVQQRVRDSVAKTALTDAENPAA